MKSIVKTIRIEAPVESVWECVTDSTLIGDWLMVPCGFQPVVGTAFTFQSECEGRLETIRCEVLEVREPRRLSFSWKDQFAGLDSVITFDLSDAEGNTIVEFHHSGWRDDMDVERLKHASTWGECMVELTNCALAKSRCTVN